MANDPIFFKYADLMVVVITALGALVCWLVKKILDRVNKAADKIENAIDNLIIRVTKLETTHKVKGCDEPNNAHFLRVLNIEDIEKPDDLFKHK
jgi:hypothetical protein